MAIPVRALVIVSAVIAGAALFTATSLSKTSAVVDPPVANTEMGATAAPILPSYMARMPAAGKEPAKVATVSPPKRIVPRAPVLPPAPVVAVAELAVEAAPSFSHKVIATGANVRSGPKKTYPQVFTLQQGSWVNISENVSGWVKVTDEAGREGWVYGALLQAETPVTVAAAE